MKEVKYTEQGFSYIDVTLLDVIKWGGYGICNGCNRGPMEHMKLIYILGDTYCDRCFNAWLERVKNYPKKDIETDLMYQKEGHLMWYACHIGDVIDKKGNKNGK